MTCVIGAVDEKKKIWMGGDSAGVGPNWSMGLTALPKVFKNGKFLIGYTTSFRMGQLLQFQFSPPARKSGEGLYKYMATRFVDAIRRCFRKGGFLTTKDASEKGGTFLVGGFGRLFGIRDDFHVFESQQPFAACGCGYEIALGAMAASDLPIKARVLRALEITESLCAGVRGPFTVKSLQGGKE